MEVSVRRAVIVPAAICAMTWIEPAAAETHAEAATRIAEAIASFPSGDDPSEKARLRDDLEVAKRSVATLVVQVDTQHLEIFVDGARLGRSPLLRLLYVEPGEHTVLGRLEDQTVVSETHDVGAGGRALYRLRGTDESSEKPIWPGFVLGGIGVASIATGVGLLVASLGKESDAEALALDTGSCNLDRLSGRCAQLASLVASRNALLDGSTVAFVISGIAAAATVGYVLVPLPTESLETSLAIGPGAVPRGIGLGLRGSF